MDPLQKVLFQRILFSPDAFYKHQKIGDADLSSTERSEILTDCFKNKKGVFIQRYEKFITSKECPLFDEATDPASSFILERIRNRNIKKDRRNIRNRRYIAMQDIKKKGDYFSDEKMREREPYLYDVMIGRFLGEEDQKNLRPTVAHELEWGWSGMIEQFEASQEIADRRRVQKTEYEGVHDANPSHERISRLFAHINNKDDSDDEMDLDDIKEELEQISREDAEALGDELEGNSGQLRQEFESYMMERFLAGRDGPFFDYKPIDENERLDDSDQIRERDEEERWFDED